MPPGTDTNAAPIHSVIGIDPGLTGSVALCSTSIGSAPTVSVWDTPVVWVKGQGPKGSKRMYDVAEMARLMRQLSRLAPTAIVERQQARPGQGVVSMFRTGYGLGLWEGILAALGIPYQLVAPSRWQPAILGSQRGKAASLLEAKRRFPSVAEQLSRQTDHGRSDALLLCQYGMMQVRSAP